MMAETSAELADITVLTAEDPHRVAGCDLAEMAAAPSGAVGGGRRFSAP